MTDPTETRQYLKATEVADLLRINRQDVYLLAKQGLIPSTRIGPRRYRYPRAELMAVLADNTSQAQIADSLERTARRGSAA